MSFSLIVPIAADKIEYENKMPYLFGFHEDGTLLCIKSIEGLDLSRFDAIYFSVLHKHDEKYSLSELLQMQFRHKNLDKAKVVILEQPTSSQADTIYQTIKKENITGGIFIKDADGYFECDFTINNGMAIYPLDKLDMVNPHNKSFIDMDDQFYITNIIENKIISRYFNAGGYLFENANLFCKYFEKLSSMGNLYLSHIVYSMLLDRIPFRPFPVEKFQDWGNMNLYKYYNYNK